MSASALSSLPLVPTQPSIALMEPAAARQPILSQVLNGTPTGRDLVAALRQDTPLGEDAVLYTWEGKSPPRFALGKLINTRA